MMKTIEGEIYLALSECYKEPTEGFAGDVASGRLYELIGNGLRQMDVPFLIITETIKNIKMGDGEEEISSIYKRLKDEYYSIFFPLYVVPVESVYKEWKKGETGKGYIMGDPAIEMRKRYEMLGIEIPQVYKDTPDHISLLLEYASLLCENLSREARAGFVIDHLDWVEDMRDDIYKHSESTFYRSVADITVAFVRQEMSNLSFLRVPEGGCEHF